MSGPALSRVLAALERIGHPARPSGDEYSARCPNHDDRKPSLAVGEKSGKAVLYCHALCRNADILGHLSLAFEDLFDEPLDRKSRDMTARTVKEYHYPNLNGGLAGIETRQRAGRDGKRPVYPMTPQPDGSWSAKASEALKTTPFGLPLVVAAVERGDAIWVTEGPPDATTLIERCGVVATTNQGGAGKWTEAHSHWLKDADVVVCLDRNSAGDNHGRVVLATLLDVAHFVAVKRPPAPHTDVTDLIEAGGTLDQLETVDIAELLDVPIGAPEQPVPELPADDASDDDDPGPDPGASYQPIDLGPYLRGEVRRATPSVGVYRCDGLQLLYPGKAHVVFGEMESGKSWLQLMCAAAELNAGHDVGLFHFEESDPSDTVERLQVLQVPDHVIESRFHFAGPTEVCKSTSYLLGLAEHRPTLVLLDGVNEAMGLNGMDVYAPDGATAFRARFIRPFTSRGAAVLAGDHVVKDSSARGRSPMGSVHKGNGIDGSLILLENADPFGRGMRGRSHVFVTKDRPGYLRQRGRPVPKEPAKSFMGELVIDDTRTSAPMLDAVLFAPKPADSADGAADNGQGDAVLREQVARAVAGQPGGVESARHLIATCRVAGVKASDKRITAAADYLAAAAQFESVPGSRGAVGFRVAPATAAQDRQ